MFVFYSFIHSPIFAATFLVKQQLIDDLKSINKICTTLTYPNNYSISIVLISAFLLRPVYQNHKITRIKQDDMKLLGCGFITSTATQGGVAQNGVMELCSDLERGYGVIPVWGGVYVLNKSEILTVGK